jgi:DNA-binding MarR family transcriptional regulator
MEKEGLITRIPKRKGRPYTEIKLTDSGKDLCEKGVEILKNVVSETMSPLRDGDFEKLNKPLRTLRQKAADNLHIELSPPPSISPEMEIKLN